MGNKICCSKLEDCPPNYECVGKEINDGYGPIIYKSCVNNCGTQIHKHCGRKDRGHCIDIEEREARQREAREINDFIKKVGVQGGGTFRFIF